MKLLQTIDQAVVLLTRGAFYAGKGWILTMMFLTTADVALRWFLGKPIPGTLEVSEYMLVVFAVLCLAFVHESGSNVRVTVFETLFPRWFQALAAVVSNLLALSIIALLTWQAWNMGIDEMRFRTVSDSLKIPVYPFKFLLAFGAALLCLQLLRSLVSAVTRLLKPSVTDKG